MSRPPGLLQIGWWLALVGALFYARFGYAYGAGDHDEMIPQLLRMLDPSLYPADWFLQGEAGRVTVRTPFLLVLRALAVPFGVEGGVFALWLLVLAGVTAGVYGLAFRLTERPVAAALAALVAVVGTPLWALGGNGLMAPLVVPEPLAWAFALPAVGLFMSGKRWAAGALLGVAGLFQLLVGTLTVGALGLVWLWEIAAEPERRQRWAAELGRAVGFGLVYLAVALPVFLPTALAQAAGAPAPDDGLSTFYVIAQLRQPHHYLFLHFGERALAQFALLCVLGGGAFVWLKRHRARTPPAFVGRLLAVIALLCGVAVMGTEGLEILFIAKLQFYKLTVLAAVLLVALVAAALVERMPSRWADRLQRALASRWGWAVAAVAVTAVGIAGASGWKKRPGAAPAVRPLRRRGVGRARDARRRALSDPALRDHVPHLRAPLRRHQLEAHAVPRRRDARAPRPAARRRAGRCAAGRGHRMAAGAGRCLPPEHADRLAAPRHGLGRRLRARRGGPARVAAVRLRRVSGGPMGRVPVAGRGAVTARQRLGRSVLGRRAARLRVRARRQIRRTGPFLKPVLTLVGGTAAAQALVFAARPVLTRLFSPEAFGVLTVFVTLVGLAPTFATGRYDDAVLLPEKDDDAAALLSLALGLAALTALALLLALPLREAAARAMGEPAAATAFLLLPPAVALCAGGLALETWHTRFGRFGLLSGARLAQSAAVLTVQLGAGALAALGLWQAGGVALAAGAALGFAVLFSVLGVAAVRQGRGIEGFGWADVRRLAVRYGRFPRFTAPAALLNTLGSRAPVLLLAAFFGSGAVGQFGVAFGSLALPLGVLTGAVGQVYGRDGAEAVRAGRLGPLALRVTRGLLAVVAYPALAVAATGPVLFAFVFGEAWAEAGRYAQAVAAWAALAAVAVPLTRTFDLAERQRADLAFSVAMGVALAAVLAVASQRLDALGTVWAAGVAGALLRALHIGWMLRVAGAPLLPAVRYGGWAVLVAAACALLPGAAAALGLGGAPTLAGLVLGGLLYAGLVVRRELRPA